MPAIAHSSTVGSSTAGRILNCPRSYILSKNVRRESSSYADHGSMCHAAIEAILRGEVDEDAAVIGMQTEWGAVDDDDFHDLIKPALKAFDNIFSQYPEDVDLESRIEEQVVFPGIEDSFGTADVITTAPDATYILDWKFGRGVEVTAKGNSQVLFAAAAGRFTLPEAFPADKPIRGVIVQPAFTHNPYVWEFDHDEVSEFEDALVEAWVSRETAPLKMGDHCKFCPAKPTCPAQFENIKKLSTIDMKGRLPKAPNVPKALTPKPASNVTQLRSGARHNAPHTPAEAVPGPASSTRTFTVDDLDVLLPLAYELEDWAKSIMVLAHQEMEAGREIAGYQLEEKRAQRKWVDEDAAIKQMLNWRMPVDAIYKKQINTPAQVEKWIDRNNTLRAKKMRGKKLAELTTKQSSGTTIRKVSEDRPAVEPPHSAPALGVKAKMIAKATEGKSNV